MATPDATPDVTTLVKEFFSRLADDVADTLRNVRTSLTTPRAMYWLRLVVIVAGYIMIRPLIELFFAKMFERKLKKEEEARKKEHDSFLAPGHKAKKNANYLRTGGNVEEEDNEEDEATAKASGTSRSGKGTQRQRKTRNKTGDNSEGQQRQLTDQEILELLDWSESDEDEKTQKDR
ncbi:hypothetical protein VTN49DRAFT_6778 [Thermomyces lanuginosus]|uniref:uncharacterized protein n=1 Tax=Thermomyces lanuginosus TaxID=5541 RepID=UPI003744473A